jgi:dTDP-4-dehydrorhamnose 3,5-epimerase-like enzyme
MENRVTIEPIDFPTDMRGFVLEPVGPDELPRQRNVHLVVTLPGCVRGNHYHRRGSEITAVLGPGLLRYRDGSEIRDVHIPKSEAYRVRIPPGVAHAFQNTGTEPSLLIGFNTEPHDPRNPDVVRDELIKVD